MRNYKTYYVRWCNDWGVSYSTVVRAEHLEHAWRKVRWRHPFSTHRVVEIREVKGEEL